LGGGASRAQQATDRLDERRDLFGVGWPGAAGGPRPGDGQVEVVPVAQPAQAVAVGALARPAVQRGDADGVALAAEGGPEEVALEGEAGPQEQVVGAEGAGEVARLDPLAQPGFDRVPPHGAARTADIPVGTSSEADRN